ncbi:DUF202 domain-containing protein [Martelella alba]|uniref:DUF202 domain-containing protein n=1 Tax=Martelella alba TaxID=2590451 RepID=A0ABY2SRQ0_9HYPH|nr:DUF202 domain-containing protein [Martelella alba]TKI08885.1 DUF202 domain-containing protein [Martelella alba]
MAADETPSPHVVARDPGLQPERTRLSWARTLFILALDGVFFIRIGLVDGSAWLICAGASLLLLATFITIGRLRSQQSDHCGLRINTRRYLSLLSWTIVVVGGLLIGHITVD